MPAHVGMNRPLSESDPISGPLDGEYCCDTFRKTTFPHYFMIALTLTYRSLTLPKSFAVALDLAVSDLHTLFEHDAAMTTVTSAAGEFAAA